MLASARAAMTRAIGCWVVPTASRGALRERTNEDTAVPMPCDAARAHADAAARCDIVSRYDAPARVHACVHERVQRWRVRAGVESFPRRVVALAVSEPTKTRPCPCRAMPHARTPTLQLLDTREGCAKSCLRAPHVRALPMVSRACARMRLAACGVWLMVESTSAPPKLYTT